MKRILLLAGAAAAGVAAYVVLRPPGASHPTVPTPDASRVAPDAAAPPPAPFIRRPVGPGRDGSIQVPGTAVPGTGGGSAVDERPSVVFEKELRETGWANEQEKELTLRLRHIVDALARRDTPIDIDSIECRHTQCRVAVHARDEAALGRFYAELESPAGLYGWADNLLLGPVERAPDGQVTTHVIALFDRE